MKFRVDSMEEAQKRMDEALSRIDELENSTAASTARAVSGETAFCYEKRIGDTTYEVCISISAKG